jgi:hypothetical protein
VIKDSLQEKAVETTKRMIYGNPAEVKPADDMKACYNINTALSSQG